MKTINEIMEESYDEKSIISSCEVKDTSVEDGEEIKLNRVELKNSYLHWRKHQTTKHFLSFIQEILNQNQALVENAVKPETAYLAGKQVALLKRIQYYATRGHETT